jgi:hypothetical protein
MVNDKIILVSDPDDVLVDGFRILLFDLDSVQGEIFTRAITSLDDVPQTVIYTFRYGQDSSWLMNKYHQADLIIFNADSLNELMVGFFSGKKNSYYFGNLKTLNEVNKSVIYGVDDCQELLSTKYRIYG